MPRLISRQPRYCRHNQSGLPCVYLDGKRHMLPGSFGSAESRTAFDRLIAKWLANDRHIPVPPPPEAQACAAPTISVVIQQFWEHAQTYYPPKERANFLIALRHLNRLYGETPAAKFGTNAMYAWRDTMIPPCQYHHPTTGKIVHKRDWSRSYVNKQLGRIKALFKWAASRELVPIGTYQSLLTVEALRAGRTSARETLPVQPVPADMVRAVLDRLPAAVRILVELEALTGARGGELLIMRRCDLDMSGKIWIYQPATHKNQWRGMARKIPIGPRAQKLMAPFLLKLSAMECIFSPADSVKDLLAKRNAARQTPLTYGNAPGTNRGEAPKRSPGDHYTPTSFRCAIQRACEAAFPPPAAIARGRVATGKIRSRRETDAEWRKRIGAKAWAEAVAWRKAHRFHPHQLRHTRATEVRGAYGLEGAAAVLGHKSVKATEIYAKVGLELAIRIMGEVG